MTTLHFTPPNHWMNDPNGLVWHGGRYHLYYQCNPYAPVHADMSWGHASSTDLIAWQHHPIALMCTEEEEIYSGSVVADLQGVSGYGTPETPALLAFYTSLNRHTRIQAQKVASSLDDGLTWTQHPGNPVLDRHSTDFRDPKVIRWEGPDESYWVMATVEAVAREVRLFRSDDLLAWTPLSVFGPLGATEGIWECPDLFPLEVDATGERLWVLLVSLFPGGAAGGSGTQYFVGRFDGTTFTPLRRPGASPSDAAWLDHGPDNYAGVTFAGLPDDRRTLIGWMSNWVYARALPTVRGTRGMMTLARRLGLVRDATSWPVLTQEPVLPSGLDWSPVAGHCTIPETAVVNVTLDAPPGAQASVRLRGRADGTGGVLVRVTHDEVSVDRRAVSGDVPGFAGVARAPRLLGVDHAEVRIVLAEASVEVFVDGGTCVLTCRILPEPDAVSLTVRAETPGAAVNAVRVGRLP